MHYITPYLGVALDIDDVGYNFLSSIVLEKEYRDGRTAMPAVAVRQASKDFLLP